MGFSLFVLNQKRHFILFNILIIACLVIGSAFLGFKIKEDALLLTRNALQSVLHQSYNSYNLWLDRQIATNNAIANSKKVSRLISDLKLTGNGKSKSELIAELHNYTSNNALDGYQIITRDGYILLGTGLTTNKFWQPRKSFPAEFNKAFVGESIIIPPMLEEFSSTPYDGNMTQQGYVMQFLSPVYDDKHQQIAVFASIISIDKELSNIISGGRISKTGETYLLNDNGLMLSKSRYQSELMQRGLLKPNEDTIGQLELRNPGPESTFISSQENLRDFPLTFMASEIAKKRSGYNMKGYRDYRGVNVYGAWLWDPRSGIGITTEIDVAEASKVFNTMTLANIFLVVLLLAAALFMICFISSGHKIREEHLLRVKDRLESEVKRRTLELEEALTQLRIQADFDSLTQLPNRRVFEETYDKAWAICERNNKHLGVLILDVDFFKNYNDNYGHLAGDDCLKEIANALNTSGLLNRPLDLLARYGGEEFIVLLTDTSPEYVQWVSEQLRTRIEDTALTHEHRNDDLQICTISLGVVCIVPNEDLTKQDIIEQADKALYLAKYEGRNRSEVFDEERYKTYNLTHPKQGLPTLEVVKN